MNKAAILAAGEGSRIKSIAIHKPIVKINGTSLLELTIKNLQFNTFTETVIIFNENQKTMDISLIPSLKNSGFRYFFKTTQSSMHSLYEVVKILKLEKGEYLFVSMVDSIVRVEDAKNFHDFCRSLQADESALLVTTFVEDENPLTLKTNESGFITEFQCAISKETRVTSGVYYFSENIVSTLKEMVESGDTKMRNFLTELIKRGYKIKAFEVEKTLDIDRPEDIQSAESFFMKFPQC